MNTRRIQAEIAVIGAGWAGLSAAANLCSQANVTLFEASRQAGGRARALNAPHSFEFLDNGQHILLGAYHSTHALMRQIGANPETAFHRMPLQWHIHEGIQFQTASLPAPLHLAFGLWFAKNLSLSLKRKLFADMRALKSFNKSRRADISIDKWLQQRNTPRRLIGEFWQPLVWGALNTPLEQASLRILCNILADGVWTNKAGSDYCLPRQDLERIIAEPALNYLHKHGANVQTETRAERLVLQQDGRVNVNGKAFDAVILAVAPYHAAALMPSEMPHEIQTAYEKMNYHAITTVYLKYAKAVNLPAALTGLSDGTAQWLLDRGKLGLSKHEVAAVISVSDKIGKFSTEEWTNKVHQDIQRICPHLENPPLASRVITEQRATPAANPNRVLPDLAWLHANKIFPAGDYLHVRYPATLEAAVQSGTAAAELCRAVLKERKNSMQTHIDAV